MSYENTPMKIQWREIDGRQVPFVLPQYWDTAKRDWVVTSEHDRLPVDARLTGSIVERFNLHESAGTIPAGSRKNIVTTDEGLSLRSPSTFNEFVYASLFFRRNEGEICSLSIVYGGTDMVGDQPRVDFEMTNINGVIAVTEKVPLLTNDFSIAIEAGDNGDLICRNLRLYLWRA